VYAFNSMAQAHHCWANPVNGTTGLPRKPTFFDVVPHLVRRQIATRLIVEADTTLNVHPTRLLLMTKELKSLTLIIIQPRSMRIPRSSIATIR
jgi:hypothetical protein